MFKFWWGKIELFINNHKNRYVLSYPKAKNPEEKMFGFNKIFLSHWVVYSNCQVSTFIFRGFGSYKALLTGKEAWVLINLSVFELPKYLLIQKKTLIKTDFQSSNSSENL